MLAKDRVDGVLVLPASALVAPSHKRSQNTGFSPSRLSSSSPGSALSTACATPATPCPPHPLLSTREVLWLLIFWSCHGFFPRPLKVTKTKVFAGAYHLRGGISGSNRWNARSCAPGQPANPSSQHPWRAWSCQPTLIHSPDLTPCLLLCANLTEELLLVQVESFSSSW